MSERRKPLPARHPEAIVAKTKLWTHDRSIVEAEGPYDDVAGTLLLAVSIIAHPKPKQKKAMRACVEALGFGDALKDAEKKTRAKKREARKKAKG